MDLDRASTREALKEVQRGATTTSVPNLPNARTLALADGTKLQFGALELHSGTLAASLKGLEADYTRRAAQLSLMESAEADIDALIIEFAGD